MEACVESGILEGYLDEFRAEVSDIMFTLFDQERETRLYHERLKKQATEEGLAEGRAKGLEEGKAEGLAEGKSEGRTEALSESVRQLMGNLGIDINQAMDALGIPLEDRDVLKQLVTGTPSLLES